MNVCNKKYSLPRWMKKFWQIAQFLRIFVLFEFLIIVEYKQKLLPTNKKYNAVFGFYCLKLTELARLLRGTRASCTINISHFLQKMLNLEKHSTIFHCFFNFVHITVTQVDFSSKNYQISGDFWTKKENKTEKPPSYSLIFSFVIISSHF